MEGSRAVLENLALLASGDLEALEHAARRAAGAALEAAMKACAAGDVKRRVAPDLSEPEWTYGIDGDRGLLCVTIDAEFPLAALPEGPGQELREQAALRGAQKALAHAGLEGFDCSAWARSLSGSGKRFSMGMSVEFDWKALAAGALAKREAEALRESAPAVRRAQSPKL